MKKFLALSLILSLALQQVIYSNNINQSESTETTKSKKIQNIEKIFNLTINKDMFVDIARKSADQVSNQFPDISKENLTKLKIAQEEFLIAFTEEFLSEETIDKLVKHYDELYTETEIEEIVRFYESETGKKVLKTMPETAKFSVELSTGILQKHMNKYMSLVSELTQNIENTTE